MNNRERFNAIMHYQPYDRMPVTHFYVWGELLDEWEAQGHIKREEWRDRDVLTELAGFDMDFPGGWAMNMELMPEFEVKVLQEFPDGTRHVLNKDGVIVRERPGHPTIPAEVEHTLVDRKSWEKDYRWRLEYSDARVAEEEYKYFPTPDRTRPVGLFVGSMIGFVRDWVGVVNLSYLLADDPSLVREIIDVSADMQYLATKRRLEICSDYDYAHFWEDICYKNGPLFSPKLLRDLIAKHYRRTTELLLSYGIDIVTLDCDGTETELIPLWLENGVNTAFPIEIGSCGNDFPAWRKKFGKALRGVGGVDKRVFAMDYEAVDAEIERLKPWIAEGGFLPCPDHLLPLGTKLENLQYYTEKMRRLY
ncbi:MAG: hypothetical protein FWF44_06635 [Defluviitaleaceae bacterium]|nr:hypothetical protein [Defluviitaleaceae bacterium]